MTYPPKLPTRLLSLVILFTLGLFWTGAGRGFGEAFVTGAVVGSLVVLLFAQEPEPEPIPAFEPMARKPRKVAPR